MIQNFLLINSRGKPTRSTKFLWNKAVRDLTYIPYVPLRVSKIIMPKDVFDDIKQRRFNLIDRSVQKARQEIMAQEDENVFKALDESGNKEE